MAVNSMSFKQSATLINEVLEQMTGQTSIAPVDEAEFVAVGTTLLQTGYDALNTAVSQVLTEVFILLELMTLFIHLLKEIQLPGEVSSEK